MEKISDAGLFDTLLGARLSLRDQAKQILSMMDRSHPEDVAKAGWTLVDITLLERLAEMKMLGIEEAP